jgi:UDP:flavonoid glycosyltransferase YjiC (YdhE family)
MSRLLLSCFPGYGHLQPLLPLAAAYRDLGWEVAVATGPDLVARAEEHGFQAFPTGLSMAESERRYLERFPGADLLPVEERLRMVGPHLFVDVAARERARDLVPLVGSWQPDLVLHDVMELAAPLAAMLHGVRRIAHGVSLMNPSPEQLAAIGPALEQLYAEWGVRDGVATTLDAPFLDLCPPSLQLGPPNPFAQVRPLRPTQPPATAGESLPVLDALPYDRTVHVTLGTVVNDAPGVFEAVLAGLRDEPVNLVVTTGPDRDPASLGPQPPHVLLASYLPHADLLPRVDAVVGHAGAGTLLATLAHGLPTVLLPHGAEQHVNAMVVAAAGAGELIVPEAITADAVRSAVRRVLDDSRPAAIAAEIAAEIAAMPGPHDVAAGLEETAEIS